MSETDCEEFLNTALKITLKALDEGRSLSLTETMRVGSNVEMALKLYRFDRNLLREHDKEHHST